MADLPECKSGETSGCAFGEISPVLGEISPVLGETLLGSCGETSG